MNKVRINSTSISYLTQLFCASDPLNVGINSEDIVRHIDGKSGFLYSQTKGAGQSVGTLLKQFFAELSSRKQVQDCTHIMICIAQGSGGNVIMDDMETLHDFVDEMDDKECIWNVRTSGTSDTTVYVACTTADKRFVAKLFAICDYTPPSIDVLRKLIEIESRKTDFAENNEKRKDHAEEEFRLC